MPIMSETAHLNSIVARVNTLTMMIKSMTRESWRWEQYLGNTIVELRQDVVRQYSLIDKLL